MLKKIRIPVKLISMLAVLSIIGSTFLVGCCDIGTRDPNFSFQSLEELQMVLSKDFYFFDFGEERFQGGRYYATANTISSRRIKKGDFEYIGYEIYYVEAPFPQYTNNAPSLFVTAISGKNLDGLADELRRNFDSNITDEQMTIDGIECIYISRPTMYYQLYFMIENVRYCFEMSIQETMFLSISESAIAGRYQNI